MLSRVADALFWMSRYLERAEHVTRLVDVWFHLELDLRAVTQGPRDAHWCTLATILQQPLPPFENGTAEANVVEWMTFDAKNPSSIVTCIARARANARGVRGSINSDVWRELNKLYWQICDPTLRRQALESPHEVFQAVECGSQLFQGVCDATLDHDEGWRFIQLGKFLERADKTMRILDVHAPRLQERADPADLPISNVQWGAVLKSCRSYEAYQRRYVGRVEPERVVEFLLLHPTYPRSVRFSLESAAEALTAVAGGAGLGTAHRVLGRVLADLKFIELDQVLRDGLHGLLASLLARCSEVSRFVQEHYAAH